MLRGELHRIELDLAVLSLDVWGWWPGGFGLFCTWCDRWPPEEGSVKALEL